MDIPTNHQLVHYYFVVVGGGYGPGAEKHFALTGNSVTPSALYKSVAALEDMVGATCINPRRFGLTAKGHEVFAWAKHIVEVFLPGWERLRVAKQVVRFGAPDYALREYLGKLGFVMEKKYGVHVQFYPLTEHEIMCALLEGKLDMGMTALNRPLQTGLAARALVEIEPVILAPTAGVDVGAKKPALITKAAGLWGQGIVRGRLACADETHSVRHVLDAELKRMSVTWPDREIVAYTSLVPMMVAMCGYYGLSLNLDKLSRNPGTYSIALPGFENVRYGPVWREPMGEVQAKLVKEIELIARESKLALVA